MLTELFYGNHFAIDTYYIKSLCCTPKTSTVLYINYISIKNELARKTFSTAFMHSLILMALRMPPNKQ